MFVVVSFIGHSAIEDSYNAKSIPLSFHFAYKLIINSPKQCQFV
jgi:hypothetical protein